MRFKIAYNNSDSKLPKANEKIQADKVRLVDENGEMLGVVPIEEALKKAKSKGLDLVEISPNAEPPVCKMLDFGKFKFEQQRKKNNSKKKQKVAQLKEIKLRPTIDKHDLQVKMNSVLKFLKNGDKVKFTLRFRGREVTHQEIGMNVMDIIKEQTAEVAKIEFGPKMDGKQIIMVISPK